MLQQRRRAASRSDSLAHSQRGEQPSSMYQPSHESVGSEDGRHRAFDQVRYDRPPICYGMSGTGVAYGAILLGDVRYQRCASCYALCYTVRGTETAHGGTRTVAARAAPSACCR
eukprot:3770677-Rhodomonas_salina.2